MKADINIMINIIRKPYFSKLDDVVHPELPATATYGIDGGAAEPVEAIKPITDVIAAAPRAPPEAKATGTAIVGTS